MDLTVEEREAVREMHAKIRQVAEDFAHEYFGRLAVLAPKERILYLGFAGENGKALLWGLAAAIELYEYPGQCSDALAVVMDSAEQMARLTKQFEITVECFRWAAARCLGDEFTPAMRSGHSKVAAIAGVTYQQTVTKINEQEAKGALGFF
jgi:hypothetical protein